MKKRVQYFLSLTTILMMTACQSQQHQRLWGGSDSSGRHLRRRCRFGHAAGRRARSHIHPAVQRFDRCHRAGHHRL